VFGSVKLAGLPEELVGNPLARTLSGRFELFAAEDRAIEKIGISRSGRTGPS